MTLCQDPALWNAHLSKLHKGCKISVLHRDKFELFQPSFFLTTVPLTMMTFTWGKHQGTDDSIQLDGGLSNLITS